jgi:hypothetical protein
MDITELKTRLGRILAEEEGGSPVDWQSVRRLSDELLGELQIPAPVIVDEYLRGSDRRQQDNVYGYHQRAQLLAYLRDAA